MNSGGVGHEEGVRQLLEAPPPPCEEVVVVDEPHQYTHEGNDLHGSGGVVLAT